MTALLPQDAALLDALAGGMPLVARPYAALGAAVGLDESEVIARIAALREAGVIKRFGVVVRHRELGYVANAMVVWDLPDEAVGAIGHAAARAPFVTLCYQRPRRPPAWPYNLFTMIHGRERAAVLRQIAALAQALGVEDRPRAVLFSRQRFKQNGARYGLSRQLAQPGSPEEERAWTPSIAAS